MNTWQSRQLLPVESGAVYRRPRVPAYILGLAECPKQFAGWSNCGRFPVRAPFAPTRCLQPARTASCIAGDRASLFLQNYRKDTRTGIVRPSRSRAAGLLVTNGFHRVQLRGLHGRINSKHQTPVMETKNASRM